MEKEMLQKALALSSARTMHDFKYDVLRAYVEQKEVETTNRDGGPIYYRIVWGKRKEFVAGGYSYDGRTIRIKAGSDFAYNETSSLKDTYIDMRDELIKQGVVEEVVEGKYVFTSDYTFPYFSTAASVIRGVVINGPRVFERVADHRSVV